MMEYEQVRKKNILLHIYLFSSEMKRRRTTQKERERESNIISLLLSLSLSLLSTATTTKKEKERGGIQLMNNSLQAILGENKRKLSRTDINLRAMLNKK